VEDNLFPDETKTRFVALARAKYNLYVVV